MLVKFRCRRHLQPIPGPSSREGVSRRRDDDCGCKLFNALCLTGHVAFVCRIGFYMVGVAVHVCVCVGTHAILLALPLNLFVGAALRAMLFGLFTRDLS